MPRSYGHWLDPRTSKNYPVSTHQDWILENAALVGVESAVAGLDRLKDEDRIRIIGCEAGLVRVRDYGVRASVQFWLAEPDKMGAVLKAIQHFMSEQEFGPLKSVWLNNLATGDEITLTAQELVALVEAGRTLFPKAPCGS